MINNKIYSNFNITNIVSNIEKIINRNIENQIKISDIFEKEIILKIQIINIKNKKQELERLFIQSGLTDQDLIIQISEFSVEEKKIQLKIDNIY